MAIKTTDTTNDAGCSPCTPEAHQKADGEKPEMLKITREDWKRKHRDFKTIINGQRYIMAMTKHGTSLVPVNVVKEI